MWYKTRISKEIICGIVQKNCYDKKYDCEKERVKHGLTRNILNLQINVSLQTCQNRFLSCGIVVQILIWF